MMCGPSGRVRSCIGMVDGAQRKIDGALNSVWGTGTDDVWTVGDSGQILHWDGKQW